MRHAIHILPAVLVGVSLAACQAGLLLKKPGATVKDFNSDQAACKVAVANKSTQSPSGGNVPTTSASEPNSTQGTSSGRGRYISNLGVRLMDERVYNCMLAKGWQPAIGQ